MTFQLSLTPDQLVIVAVATVYFVGLPISSIINQAKMSPDDLVEYLVPVIFWPLIAACMLAYYVVLTPVWFVLVTLPGKFVTEKGGR